MGDWLSLDSQNAQAGAQGGSREHSALPFLFSHGDTGPSSFILQNYDVPGPALALGA